MRLLTVVSTLVLSTAAHAAPLDLTSASVAELAQAMESGHLDSETLITQALARIEAYDDKGPAINAVLHVNENALEEARALDAERARSGPRSPWHGVPVLLKDNIDTADMPTTAGSFLLAGTMPPDDAFLARRLRDAGAVVLGKVNLSEFASGGPLSSLGGPTYNPHDPERSPSGSSGGSGASVAAAYAPLALGTDTGGSVRGPSSANGIVGLKPTLGLLSRDGIVPLALSFDTAGPMTRSVEDLALSLNVLAAVDDADPATAAAAEHIAPDYTAFLDVDALDGARIGVARDFMGADREVDWLVEAALETFRDAGAEVIDVRLPSWLLEARGDFYRTIRFPEFRAQIADYLQARDPDGPQSLDDLIAGARTLRARRADGTAPDPSRWSLMLLENEASDLDHPGYTAMRDHGLALVRARAARSLRPRIPRRDRLSHVADAPLPHRSGSASGQRPGRRQLSRDPRQHVGLSRPHRARRLHGLRTARNAVLSRPGLQRTSPHRARLRVRAAHAGAAPADHDAAPAGDMIDH